MSGCCKFYWTTTPWTVTPARGSCLLLQCLGWSTALCGCCELARRKVIGFKK